MAIQVMLDWVPWFFTANVCLRFRYFWWSDLFSKKICFQKMYFFSIIADGMGTFAMFNLKPSLIGAIVPRNA